jgi:hypothetical protein
LIPNSLVLSLYVVSILKAIANSASIFKSRLWRYNNSKINKVLIIKTTEFTEFHRGNCFDSIKTPCYSVSSVVKFLELICE